MSPTTKSFLAAVLLPAAFAAAQEKVTYNDHVRPIFAASCANCHNADKNTAGLNLTSYQATISGSSSGKVLNAGDPAGSRLYLAVTHAQEPKMPKGGAKLADKHLETIRKWIEGGLLESGSSLAMAPSKPKVELKIAASVGRPKEVAMPRGLSLEPLVRADRRPAVGNVPRKRAPTQEELHAIQAREQLPAIEPLERPDGRPAVGNTPRKGGGSEE